MSATLKLVPTRRPVRANRQPRGANPMSAPALFAGARRPRGPGSRRPGARAIQRRRATAPTLGAFPVQSVAGAYARGQRSGEPRIAGSFRSTRIVHRELIASIVGTSAFTVGNTLSLNPGLASAFPWLSTQALGWEQYKFHKLRLCYYTRTGSTTPGSIMIVPDYDAADAAPTSELNASAYRDVVEEVPWTVEFACPLDPAAMSQPGVRKYVRTGTLASNLDIKTYDSGTVFICTVDGTAVNWGKLWIEYDVELFVPQLPVAPALQNSLKITSAGTVTSAAIFGTAATYVGGLGATAVTNTITFTTAGEFLIATRLTGTVFNNQPTVTGTATHTDGTAIYTTAATTAQQAFIVRVTVPGQTLIIDWSAASTTVTAMVTDIGSYAYSNGL